MALNSLRYRIEGDNTSAMRALDQVSQKVRGLGSDMQHELGRKFAAAISVPVIEEAVRRTAEWASELAKSSQNLGISAENMQALRIAAEEAGIGTEKIFNYYNKIEAAALKALNGNKKLADSFRALGFSSGLSELKTMNTSDLLTKAFAGGSKPEGSKALLDIFGSKEVLNIKALGKELRGKSLDEYAKTKESQIVPNEDVKTMAIAWQNMLDDMKSIAVKFSGVVKVILAIVDGLAKMVNGVLGTLGHHWKGIKMITGLEKGNLNQYADESVARQESMLASIGNFIPGMASIPGMMLGIQKKPWKWFGAGLSGTLSEEAKRESEGAGEAAATLATFGTSIVTKPLGLGAGALSSGAEMANLGKLAGKAGSLAEGASSWSGGGLFGRAISNPMYKWERSALSKQMYKAIDDMGMTVSGKADMKAAMELAMEKMGLNPKMTAQEGAALLARRSRGTITSIGALASAFAAGGFGLEDIMNSDKFANITGLPANSANRKPGGQYGAGSGYSGLFGAGSGNLNVGGVFGVDLQGKLVSLNEKQTAFLEKIMEYTGRMADEDYNGEDTVPN